MLLVFVQALAKQDAVEADGLSAVVGDTGLSVFLWSWAGGFYLGSVLVAIALLVARATALWVPIALFACVVLMTPFLWLGAGDTERWIVMGAWSLIQWMALLVVGGAGLYFGTLYLLGMRLRELRVRPAGP